VSARVTERGDQFGVTFLTEPHKIATLADRELWLADFQDTEGSTSVIAVEKSENGSERTKAGGRI
jgi:hypothetical protein